SVVTAAEYAHDIQEDVDEVEIEVERADDGRLVQHGRVAAKVGVVRLEHLGVIRRQAHEQQQADRAQHQVHKAESQPKQAEQAADQRADDHSHKAAQQLGAPAGEVAAGHSAVDGHDAEVDRADQERQ